MNWRGLGIYVATIGIVMSNMLSIYVANAGIVMSNMLSNCVKVNTSIDKPIYSVLQTEVQFKLLPRLCLQNRFDLAWTVVCSGFRLSWLLFAPIVVDLITSCNRKVRKAPALAEYTTATHGPKQYSQVILSARVQRLHTWGLILRARALLCATTLKST